MPEEKELIFREEPDLPEDDDTIIDEEPATNTGRKVKIDWFENNIWHGKTGYVIWEDPTDDSELATVTVNITDFPSEDGLKEVEQNFERRRVVDYFEDEPVEVPEEEVEIEEPIPEEQPVKESLKEEAMYGLFVEVKNSDTDEIIEEKRKLMVGTKEECEDKKKHLEEVSNGVGNHINIYTVEFLGNSNYDNPSNPDKKENLKLKKDLEEHECCICHKKFKGFGNNAEPVCDGICCDDCNWRVVIPARVKEYEARPSDIDFDDEMFEDCENCREHTAIPDDDDVDFTW